MLGMAVKVNEAQRSYPQGLTLTAIPSMLPTSTVGMRV